MLQCTRNIELPTILFCSKVGVDHMPYSAGSKPVIYLCFNHNFWTKIGPSTRNVTVLLIFTLYLCQIQCTWYTCITLFVDFQLHHLFVYFQLVLYSKIVMYRYNCLLLLAHSFTTHPSSFRIGLLHVCCSWTFVHFFFNHQ